MPLTDAEIDAYVKGLKDAQAPGFDPNWAITLLLIDTIRKNAEEVAKLKRLATKGLTATQQIQKVALEAVLLTTTTTQGMEPSPIDRQKADAAASAMDTAITARKKGEQIVNVAGKVLKYAAMFA